MIKHQNKVELYGKFSSCLERMDSSKHQHDSTVLEQTNSIKHDGQKSGEK